MTKENREWARKQPWFYCSDSRAIWVKNSEGDTLKFTSIKELKSWSNKS